MNHQQDTGYDLPRETAALLTTDQLNKCKNLGLILDKYPPQTAIQDSARKSDWLRYLASKSYIDADLMQSVYTRWQNMTEAAGAQYFNATTDWRMVVGLGGETVLETDLTLHHLYGIPYIPASALKGLTRNYAATEVYQSKDSKDIEHDDPIVKGIFGTQDKAGTVIFFDAMPVNGEAGFVLDIMNAHYPNYYGEKKAPTNDQNPNPVTFLTVTNTTFMFAVAARHPKYEKDVGLVIGWLKEALQKYGVGGKTSAGYGYFTIQDEQKRTVEAQPSQTISISAPTVTQRPVPAERIHPTIPKFREGQDIKGSVITPTDELRQRISVDARAFLSYESFSTRDVLLVVTAEEAQNWKPGETRFCLFMREEVRDGCTVLLCQPRPSKKKK